MGTDYLSRYYSETLSIRACGAITTELVREITDLHGTTPNATMALGRTLTAAGLMTLGLKPESNQSLSIRFEGEGPLKIVQAQADAKGNLRGRVAVPDVDLREDIGTIDFSRSIGAGFLSVTRDLGMKEPYTGTVPLMHGNVAMDLAHYLAYSEQVPSALLIAQELDSEGKPTLAGGILIQGLPGSDEDTLDKIEKRLTGRDRSLEEELSSGESLDSIVKGLIGVEDLETLDILELRHRCSCSREYLAGILSGLDPAEIQEMIDEDRGAEITCSFCQSVYHFTDRDLADLLKKR
jgi:molecular chaperone Hsp33